MTLISAKSRKSLVVAASVTALAVTCTGTAFAAPDSSPIRQISKSKTVKIAKKQANKQITKRAPGLSVLRAETAAPTGAAGGDLTGEYPNPQIADLAVTTAKIADLAVTTGKLADDAVTSAKIADGSVAGPELAATQVVAGTPAAIAANGNAVASVQCPAGKRVLSGGGTTSSFNVLLVSSFQSGNGWIVAYHSTSAANQTITPIATCL